MIVSKRYGIKSEYYIIFRFYSLIKNNKDKSIITVFIIHKYRQFCYKYIVKIIENGLFDGFKLFESLC